MLIKSAQLECKSIVKRHNKIKTYFLKLLHNIVVTCVNKGARETCIDKRVVVLLFG